eukprot:SM000072S21242  [mRNA]  locus=s72:603668:605206:- [translate_table: standard]
MPATWPPLADKQAREGWWDGPDVDAVHVQGRRWAGTMVDNHNPKGGLYLGSTYDAASTFASYGCPHGDRAALLAAVPKSHKEFLRNLVWVHEQEGVDTGDPETSYKRLIAVHAGLLSTEPVEEQLNMLRARDVRQPRIEQLSGRGNVWKTPPELGDEVLLISGHHGVLEFPSRNRMIIDECGGHGDRPLAAIILPQRIIVRDTDVLERLLPLEATLPPELAELLVPVA